IHQTGGAAPVRGDLGRGGEHPVRECVLGVGQGQPPVPDGSWLVVLLHVRRRHPARRGSPEVSAWRCLPKASSMAMVAGVTYLFLTKGRSVTYSVQFAVNLEVLPLSIRQEIGRTMHRIAEAVSSVPEASPFWSSMKYSVLQIDVEGWRIGYKVDRI